MATRADTLGSKPCGSPAVRTGAFVRVSRRRAQGILALLALGLGTVMLLAVGIGAVPIAPAKILAILINRSGRRYADRVVLLKEGRVLTAGPPERVLTRDALFVARLRDRCGHPAGSQRPAPLPAHRCGLWFIASQ